jgi:small subunit ribosomal protein S1
MFENGTIIEATILEFNKGGVLVDVGPRGFVPLSQLTSLRRGPADETEEELNAKLSEVVGQQINVKIIELDRRRNRLILSERVAEREMRSQRREVLLDELQIGQIRKGIVSNICSFGAFVDLGGADGLAHISELSWSRVESPEELLSPGEEIDVYILSLDREDKKIALSLRRATKDPWAALESRFEAEQIVDGTVTKLAPFGAFVHLEDGVEGLAHSSDLGESALESISEGNPGKFKILSIDAPRRRIRLQPIEIDTSSSEDLAEDGELVATAENPSETDEDSEETGNQQAEIDSSTDTTQESSDEAEPSSDETSPEEDSDSKKIDTTGEEDAMIEGEPKSDA